METKIKYYMVGGVVRDMLLGRNQSDYDFVVVGATKEYMETTYGNSVGEGFPVYLGIVPGYEILGKVEIAMARKESKVGEGHKGFTFEFGPEITLEEDLQRRDFTINAMAMDIFTKQITDCYGGQEDLKNNIIRHVNSKAFVEDPLRVLRMARFSAKLGFKIHPDTIKLSKEINISTLTIERIFQEVSKALDTEHPEVFFETLLATGHLNNFFPELVKLVGIKQAHHQEDAFEHVMLSLKEITSRKMRNAEKFAMLLHDLGKGETPKEILPHHYEHEERSYKIAKDVCSRWKVPYEYEKLATWFALNHMRLHETDTMSLGKVIRLAEFIVKNNFDVGTIIHMSESDSQGRYQLTWEPLRNAVMVIKNVKADDIVAKGFSGKIVGELLHQKRVECMRSL
jgi:tRNA nucleotidyltransferase (CCA-adding enzyme)